MSTHTVALKTLVVLLPSLSILDTMKQATCIDLKHLVNKLMSNKKSRPKSEDASIREAGSSELEKDSDGSTPILPIRLVWEYEEHIEAK